MKVRWTNEVDFDVEEAEKNFDFLKENNPTIDDEILIRIATEWNLGNDDDILPEEPINTAIEILKERLKDRK